MNIPCENCLTFAICKQQLIEYLYGKDGYNKPILTVYLAYRLTLQKKCSLIERYIEWYRSNHISDIYKSKPARVHTMIGELIDLIFGPSKYFAKLEKEYYDSMGLP